MSEPEDDLRTLELARGELAERLKRQSEEAKTLDTKAQVLLAFALTALTFVLTQPMPALLRFLSGISFVLVLGFGAAALTVTRYRDPMNARDLIAKHLDRGPLGLLFVLLKSYRSAIEANDAVQAERAKRWKCALGSLALALIFGLVGIAYGGDDMPGGDEKEESPKETTSLADQVEASEEMGSEVQKDRFGGKGTPDRK